MTSDVVLTAALRNNLLSLQSTQSSIDTAQLDLSTGKKVNSALDNPESFFASQTLTNRANDLTNLLDSIGQSIEVIKAADNGITALTSLVNQAQALAQTAQSTVADGTTQASATGVISLSGSTLLTSLNGFTASGGDQIAISVTDPVNGTLVVNGASAIGTTAGGLITTASSWTVNDLINQINDINSRSGTGGNTPIPTQTVSASIDASGHINITAVNGGTLRVQFISAEVATPASRTATGFSIASSLGFGTLAKINVAGNSSGSTDTVDFTSRADASITSSALYTNVQGTLAQGSTLLSAVLDTNGTAITSFTNAADQLHLVVGGKTSGNLLGYSSTGGTTFTATTTTVQAYVDAINHDSNISSLVTASFDSTTGKISITAKDPSATDVQFEFQEGAAGQSFSIATPAYPNGLGFGTQPLTPGTQSKAQEDVRFGAASGQLASLQTQYNGVLGQIDGLVSNGDTAYQGTNLLFGDSLVTTFNEERTSTLTTAGATFNSLGLGLSTANFGNANTIGQSLTQLNAALTTVRDYGSGLATDLSTIQTRQTFTNSLITTLQEGAGNLVNADQNEEGATLLALQTRQSLGVTALSLASQSNQSILRLFQ